MTQELADLRFLIEQKRYEDALNLVDELEEMSKKSILQNIENFLIRLLIHLIKNQVEQRLTNSWAASIRDSIIKIQSLNIKDNKKSYYVQLDKWDLYLDNAFEDALFAASSEIYGGKYSPFQLRKMVNYTEVINVANKFINLTYTYDNKELRKFINEELSTLPGGEQWKLGT